MADIPGYVDRDLVTTALILGGLPADRLKTLVDQSRGDPNILLDMLARAGDSNDRKIAVAVTEYLKTLGTENLQKLLVTGGMDENLAIRSVNAAQGGRTATPTLRAVIGELGKDHRAADLPTRVTSQLQLLGVGESALDTTRTQYKSGKPPQPAPPPSAAPVPAPATAPARPSGGLLPNVPVALATPAPTAPAGGVPRTPQGVMDLQRQLNTKGAGLKVDGIYGPKTQAAERRLGGGTLAGPDGGESVSGTLGQALGGGTGGGTGGGGGGALTPLLDPKASDPEVEAYIRKTYGFSAWALEEPEVRGAVRDVARQLRGAVVDEATMDSLLEARLLSTDWWKNRTYNQRLRIQQRHEDPATFNIGIDVEFRSLQALANRIGFSVPEGRLREIARQSYEYGWEDTERRHALSAEFDYSPETGAQATAKITTDLRDRASAYLVNLSEQTIDNWGRQMVAGDMPQDAFDGYLREQAKSLFPVFAAQIDQGLATRDLVEPYAERLGKILEVDPTSIDFTQPKWMKFLQQRDEKGQVIQPMLYEVDKMARSDPNLGWDRTKNAREEAADLSRRILQSFGRTA